MRRAHNSPKKPFHLKFVSEPNRFTLSLHLNPESPPLSSIRVLKPPKIVDNQIIHSAAYLKTIGEWRKGYGSALFNSLTRVFERLAHDYHLPVVHEDFALDRISEKFLQKHGYSTKKDETSAIAKAGISLLTARRSFKPVNHELKQEEESALNWFKMHLERSYGSPKK